MKLSFEIEPTINKQYLLSKYSEETYMEYYLGIPVKKGLFKSPLRVDNTPTCSFYRNKSGDLIFKDFNGSFSGNFINVVMEKFKCNYHQALRIIAIDFNLIKHKNYNLKPIKISTTKFTDTGPAKIGVTIQNFTSLELDWWNKYGITENILKKFNVFSCNVVFLNDNYFAESAQHNPIFGYYGGKQNGLELWRIYFPKRKNYRFITNWESKKIQGFAQLPKKGKALVITKSLKDVMCLYSLGISAIAPNSENLFISHTVLADLKARFENIFVLYDNDLPGIKNLNKIKKEFPDLNYIILPRKYNAKDISDFYKLHGKKTLINLIKMYIEWLNKHLKLL